VTSSRETSRCCRGRRAKIARGEVVTPAGGHGRSRPASFPRTPCSATTLALGTWGGWPKSPRRTSASASGSPTRPVRGQGASSTTCICRFIPTRDDGFFAPLRDLEIRRHQAPSWGSSLHDGLEASNGGREPCSGICRSSGSAPTAAGDARDRRTSPDPENLKGQCGPLAEVARPEAHGDRPSFEGPDRVSVAQHPRRQHASIPRKRGAARG